MNLSYSARKGFPFSTYGETALIAVQDVVIASLVLVFGSGSGSSKNQNKSNSSSDGNNQGVMAAGAFVAGVASLAAGLMSEGVVGLEGLKYAQMVAGGVGVLGKVPQIWAVWREGGTGVLSAFAVSSSPTYFPLLLCFVSKGKWVESEMANYDGVNLGFQLPCRFARTNFHHHQRSR